MAGGFGLGCLGLLIKHCWPDWLSGFLPSSPVLFLQISLGVTCKVFVPFEK